MKQVIVSAALLWIGREITLYIYVCVCKIKCNGFFYIICIQFTFMIIMNANALIIIEQHSGEVGIDAEFEHVCERVSEC